MCGLLGLIGNRGFGQAEFSHFLKNSGYRGPDSSGIYSDESAIIGHNRLAIVDLSDRGHQPLEDQSHHLVLAYNGEIYNAPSLRKELEKLGHTFTTYSDTEVLLKAYIEWGEDALNHLSGMFAFVIWNKRNKTLFAARDHVGMKPLYYSYTLNSFYFGSEIKNILEMKQGKRNIRKESLYEYLLYGYTIAPNTAFEDIKQLMPGESLCYSLLNNELKIKKWYQFPQNSIVARVSFKEAKRELKKLVIESVQEHLISDVSVSGFLSGGLDSSILFAVAKKYLNTNLNSYTFGYQNSSYDESSYATLLANYYHVPNKIIYAKPTSEDLVYYLDLIVDHFSEPYANPTVILTYLLTKEIKKNASVVLVGDGADELFGGYVRYKALLLKNLFKPILPLLALSHSSLFLKEKGERNHFARRYRQFLDSVKATDAKAFSDWSAVSSPDLIGPLLHPDFKGFIFNGTFIEEAFRKANEVFGKINAACYADLNSFLPYNLLAGADRMSMANSVEMRLPFLSRKLIDFSFSIPDSYKVNLMTQKILLREAFKDDLPKKILSRKKRGFNPPTSLWLKENYAYIEKKSSTSRLFDFCLDRSKFKDIISAFYSDKRDYSMLIWSFLVLDRWSEKFL